MIAIKVGHLLRKPEGTRETLEIEKNIDSLKDEVFSFNGPFCAKVTLVKLPHEINVQLSDGEVFVKTACSRCLVPFEIKLVVPIAEREFIIDLSKKSLIPGEESQFIAKNTNAIDIEPMIREEILLHFPPITVCSEGCKGLCDKCGINLNKNKCSCVHSGGSSSPFRYLIG